MSVPVTVQVPAEMYGRLASVARRHGVEVSTLLIEAARRGLMVGANTAAPVPVPVRRAAPKMTDVQVAEVARLHGEGLNDAEIAAAIGANKSTVHTYRSVRLGLPSLVRGRPKKIRDAS